MEANLQLKKQNRKKGEEEKEKTLEVLKISVQSLKYEGLKTRLKAIPGIKVDIC